MFRKSTINNFISRFSNIVSSTNKIPLPEKKELSLTQWKKDIYFFKNCLILTHPDLFCRITRDDFNNLFYDLEGDLQYLCDDDRRLYLARIAASIGDGHTCLPLGFSPYKVLPLSFWWFGEDIRIIHSSAEYKFLLGAKLLTINGRPIFEIIKHINRVIPGETHQYIKSQNIYPLSSLNVLSTLGFIKDKTAVYEFEDYSGNLRKLMLNYLDEREYAPLSLSSLLSSSKEKKTVNWFIYSHEDKILYFKYGRCYDYAHAVRDNLNNPERYPEMNLLFEDIINTLSYNEVSKFILDLRGNSGGYSKLLSKYFLEKIRYLDSFWELDKNNKIYVLTDRDTYSAAVLNCLELRTETKAVFIGEPTGGSVNMFGGAKTFILPNSNLPVKCATHKLFNRGKDFSSFIPDIIISHSLEGLLSNTDEVLQYIINL